MQLIAPRARRNIMTDKILIPIFADQLSDSLSSLSSVSPDEATILMMEVRGEAEHVPHHSKKLVFLFSAMRHFAQDLRGQGFDVDYVKLTDDGNTGTFDGEMNRAVARHTPDRIRVTEPSVYRVFEYVKGWEDVLGVPVTIMPDDRFLATKAQFAGWAEGRKQLRMEYFYRDMRRQTGLLMNGDEPEGGKWNYDSENRKPAKGDLFMPKPLWFKPDATTQSVIDMVAAQYPDRFGRLEGFEYGVTRDNAKAVLAHFIKTALPNFGDYQDAMLTGEPFLYHSLISMYLNAGLLNPAEICEAVESAYNSGHAPLNATEGYIRQVIGWREYIRGIYWYKMPEYTDENALEAKRDLPWFYWSGETDMQCLSQSIGQTIEHAYAHHIQRLMITGNFALLAGVDPKALHEWYLAVYIDAFEWVELPNTIGMSQFADGGVLASKPYASSGAYINRMSDYCKSCRYNVKEKLGDDACPFNTLYWDFMARNKERLGKNPRMGMAYRNLEKMDAEQLKAYREKAAAFLEGL